MVYRGEEFLSEVRVATQLSTKSRRGTWFPVLTSAWKCMISPSWNPLDGLSALQSSGRQANLSMSTGRESKWLLLLKRERSLEERNLLHQHRFFQHPGDLPFIKCKENASFSSAERVEIKGTQVGLTAWLLTLPFLEGKASEVKNRLKTSNTIAYSHLPFKCFTLGNDIQLESQLDWFLV